jgi:3-oxoacyl-[acyl-carrier-protein] synthase-3
VATVLLGCGAALPPRVVTNDELAADLGLDAGTIGARTGVTRRHYVAEGVGPSDLGRDASAAALAAAGLEAGDVDLIVFATMTPDIAFPGSGCFLQEKLGCRTVGAMDVRAQCAGFVFALATADAFLRAGGVGRVLVVGGEVHSTALDPTPRGRNVTPRFGDGAGAVVLGTGPDGAGLLASVTHTDPTGYERFWCEYPSSRHHPARMEMVHYERGLHHYVLDDEALAREAEPALVSTVGDLLAQAGLGPDDVRLAIVHYVDPRIARRAAAAAGLADDRVLAPAERIGHVAAGGIPIALADAARERRVGRGDVVCCVAFGAGVSWGGAVLRL